MEFIYTLAFIKKDNQILMMNRMKQPWKGMWNGIGGKRNLDETALSCIKREIFEETGLNISYDLIKDKGICTWNDDFKSAASGLHLFFVNLDDKHNINTPFVMEEGFVDWRDFDWINDKDNLGVSYNIPYFLENVCFNDKRFHYKCKFNGNILEEVKVEDM